MFSRLQHGGEIGTCAQAIEPGVAPERLVRVEASLYDVRQDLATLGAERRRDGDRAGVRSAPSDRCDVLLLGDPLKAGHDRHAPTVELATDDLRVDVVDES